LDLPLHEVLARLEHDAALALCPQRSLDSVDHLARLDSDSMSGC